MNVLLALGHIAMVHKTLRLELFLGLSVLGLVVGLSHFLTGFLFAVPLLLFPDFLEQVGLAWLILVLVFDHVLVLAWLAKDGQDKHLVELVDIGQIWNRVGLSLGLLLLDSFLLFRG